MSITEIIKKHSQNKLKEYGFGYVGSEGGSRWIFEKKIDGELSQYIIYNKNIYFNGLNVQFGLSKYGIARTCSANELINEPGKVYWMYSSTDELELAIKELTEIAIQKGFECLDLLARPIIAPSRDMSKKLYKNHLELSNKFGKDFDINASNNDRDVEIKVPEKIDMIIYNSCEVAFENNEQLFLGASAFFGELIKKHFLWDWYWEEESGICYMKLNDYQIEPLSWVLNYWNVSLKFNSLAFIYKQLSNA